MDTRRRQTAERPGLLAGLNRRIRWAALFAMATMALSVVLGAFAVNQLNEQIRSRIQTALASHYTGLRITIYSARRVEGKGIVVRGLSIVDPYLPAESRQLVYVDELLIGCDTDLSRLWRGVPRVTHLAIHRMKVRAVRSEDGEWNVASLLPLPRLKASDGPPPPATIEDASLELVDHLNRGRLFSLRDVQLAVQSEPVDRQQVGQSGSPAGLHLRGQFRGDHFEQARVDGLIDPSSGRWSLRGELSDLTVSPQLPQSLTAELAKRLAPVAALRGRTQLNFQISSHQPGQALQYQVAGSLEEGRIDDPAIPYALTNVQADFVCDNRRLKIENVTARSGYATIELSCSRDGFQDDSPLVIEASTRQLSLDRRLAKILPEELRDLWHKFQPSGVVNADLKLHFDGLRYLPELLIECPSLAFTYEKFPYPLRSVRGSLHLKDGVLTIDLQALVSGQVVHMRGEVQNLGPKSVGWVEVETEGPIPLDEEMISALQPKPQAVVRSLNASGLLKFRGRFERDDPDDKVLRERIEIDLINCSMQYVNFPYPLDRIRGTLRREAGRWTFSKLQGRNDSAYVECSGSWNPDDADAQLVLDFVCTDVPLEDELRYALQSDAQQVWSQLRPRGTIDHVTANLRYDGVRRKLALDVHGEKWGPQQNIQGRSITVEPAWFPYRLDHLTGRVRYLNGVVYLQNLRGEHGQTTMELAGHCDWLNDRWNVQLERIIARRVRLNRELTSALPPKLGTALSQLHLVGPVSLDGSLAISCSKQAGASPASRWNLDVDVENGQLDCGIRCQNIRGGARLVGESSGGTFSSRGELNVDSLLYQGVQLTQLRGPFWLDDSGIVFGSWVRPSQSNRLPRQVTAGVFGGTLSLDAHVSLGRDHPFQFQAALTDGDLAWIARDALSGRRQLSGRTFAVVELSGNEHGQHTWRGKGMVRLTDADIYELPLMVRLLKRLSIRRPDTTAFTTSDIDFRVEGDRIYFDRINFHGDVISLKGSGDMTLQKQVNLEFYTLVGREELPIPIIPSVFQEASKRILLIEVEGSLEEPDITRRAFPELNERLQQLFPEATAKNSWGLPRLRSPREVWKGEGWFR